MNSSLPGSLGVDFNDSTAPANFEIVSSLGIANVYIKPTMGELMRPVIVNEETFLTEQAKIKGMNEHCARIPLPTQNNVSQKVFEHFNVGQCLSTQSNTHRYNCAINVSLQFRYYFAGTPVKR